MTDEQKIFDIVTKPVKGEDYRLVDSYRWSDGNFYIWISTLFLEDFIDEIINIFGADVFDDGGCNANVQIGYVCFDLEDLLGGYIDIEEVFAEDKLK